MVVHVRGHQKGVSFVIRGNNLADSEAKEATETGDEKVLLILTPPYEDGGTSVY